MSDFATFTDAELADAYRDARKRFEELHRTRRNSPESGDAQHRMCAIWDEQQKRKPAASKREKQVAKVFPNTDLGNAEFFASRYRGSVRYDFHNRQWLVWTGHHWRQDDGRVHGFVKDAIRSRQKEALDLRDNREIAVKWGIKSEDAARVTALLTLASKEPSLRCAIEKWNTNPMLLGVENGVIDLASGEFRAGKPEDNISIIAPVKFDAAATCPRWEQFIAEIFATNPDIAPYMQRVIGYTLTGSITEQCFWIWFGEGSNGKSTLGEVLLKLLGKDMAGTMDFPSRRWSEAAGDGKKAALLGKRFVQSSEMRSGDTMNEHLVKTLVGGDTIQARLLYKDPFNFAPVAKFAMRVNERPRIEDAGHGMWRRIRLIPFLEKFDGEKADRNLMATLQAELPGILNWAIRGCLDWQREGLRDPACVLAATQAYREEQDDFSRFLAERCIIGPGEVVASNLHSAYTAWAQGEGLPFVNQTAFGIKVGKQFPKRKSNGANVYQGVTLRAGGRQAA